MPIVFEYDIIEVPTVISKVELYQSLLFSRSQTNKIRLFFIYLYCIFCFLFLFLDDKLIIVPH